MATWLKTDTKLRKHPKLNITAADLQIRPVYLRGHLVTMWLGALDTYEDGDLSGLDNGMIADLADWSIKDADRFVQVLTNRRWLDSGLIHDWLDYAGDFLKRRHRRNPSLLNEIWAKHGKTYGTQNQQDEDSTRPVRVCTRTVHVQDTYSTSLELERELEKETTHTSACANSDSSFSASYQFVLDAWREVSGTSSADANTKQGARELAQAMDAGDLPKEHVRDVIKNGRADTVLQNQGLRGIARNFTKYLPRERRDPEGVPRRLVEYVCDLCGNTEAGYWLRQDDPAPYPCTSPRRCGGKMMPHVEKDSV